MLRHAFQAACASTARSRRQARSNFRAATRSAGFSVSQNCRAKAARRRLCHAPAAVAQAAAKTQSQARVDLAVPATVAVDGGAATSNVTPGNVFDWSSSVFGFHQA
jgi:hypothetical protein